MGYIKVTTSDTRMKAKVTPLPRSGEVNLRARRLAPPPANGKTHLPGADQLANHRDRFAGPVQCNVGLSRTSIAAKG